jgi:MoxR-like ATPase
LNTQANYIFSPELREAILIAEITQRPLLIKGEPGTGKTLLAQHLASEKDAPLFQWAIKSTTQAKDGLYFYDAVTRLNDSRFNDGKRDVSDINSYIRYEAMGEAFQYGKASVLLIDEIDKADIEFPNDLLMELDRMEFRVQETGEFIKAQTRPFVIITSNNEKELPDAFLRRCIFHYIEFPNPEMMKDIVLAHFPSIEKKLLESALLSFYKLREVPDFKKHPTTSELIDWISILLHNGASLQDLRSFPFAGCLLKSEEDMNLLKRLRP